MHVTVVVVVLIDCHLPDIHPLSRSILSCLDMISFNVIYTMPKNNVGRGFIWSYKLCLCNINYIENKLWRLHSPSWRKFVTWTKAKPEYGKLIRNYEGTLLIGWLFCMQARNRSWHKWTVTPQSLIKKILHSVSNRSIWWRQLFQVTFPVS